MDLTTLSFDEFWEWLMGHPNCILRAGTPDTILFDDEDFYWHLAGLGSSPVWYEEIQNDCEPRGADCGGVSRSVRSRTAAKRA